VVGENSIGKKEAGYKIKDARYKIQD